MIVYTCILNFLFPNHHNEPERVRKYLREPTGTSLIMGNSIRKCSLSSTYVYGSLDIISVLVVRNYLYCYTLSFYS